MTPTTRAILADFCRGTLARASDEDRIVKGALRLKRGAGVSQDRIAAWLGISQGAITMYVDLAGAARLDSPSTFVTAIGASSYTYACATPGPDDGGHPERYRPR